MKHIIAIVLGGLLVTHTTQAEDAALIKDKAAFDSLLQHVELKLTFESECTRIFNTMGDSTLGELIASFAASPMDNPRHTFTLTTQCTAEQRDVDGKQRDTHRCALSLTDAFEVEGRPEHITNTLSFSVLAKDNRLIKNSLLCY